ncbi:hypothetical protein IKW75_00505 [Candidatus Saccharibacteria bacterium]|nr:hypothetical protein [Candidatus Saccharibacteria bacterium]
MSKTTKIIAALGVVAGLGVAALPAFTFAEGEPSVTGDVEVVVEVEPAIAMTITGNNDNGEHYNGASGTYTYTAVSEPAQGANPKTNGWYVRSGESEPYTYTLATDETVQSGTTYYVRTSNTYNPVDSFNPSGIHDQTLDGHPIPGTAITGTSSSYTAILPNGIVEGSASNGFRSTITVYTNATNGYTLTLKDGDTDNSLKQSGTGAPTIPAVGTQSPSNAIEAGSSAWGFTVSSQHGTPITTPAAYAAVPISTATAASISSLDSKTDGGDQTIVEYAVSTSGDQATGVYTDTIVYTATTK